VGEAKAADADRIEDTKEAHAEKAGAAKAKKTKELEVEKVEATKATKVVKEKQIKDEQVAEVGATKAADGVGVNSAMVGEIKALNDARIAKIKTEKAAKIEEIKQEKAGEVEGAPKTQGVRKHAADPDSHFEDGWSYVSLDDKEVAERGSYCIDGSTPGYFYKPGTIDDKWIIAIEGGKMFCEDEDVCVQMLGNDFASADSMVYLKLFETDEFKEYNMVELHHCDGGMFMSDRADPLVHNGNKMYFRGKRIIDHVFDTLKGNKTFASATEVLITGGSGGGQATTVLADYLAGLMPTSVHKIGAVPMSGWYTSDWNDIEYTFGMHEMSGTIAPGCRDALDESEQYKCLDPRVSYEHSQTPMFVVQLLDSQSLAGAYAENTTLAETSRAAWTNCMETSTAACSDSDRSVLQGYLDELVAGIQGGTKHTQQGEGGFLSTCTKHVFYKEDEYDHYADKESTIADAVATWWRNLGTAEAKWFLPCTLNTKGQAQCESSCAYDSGSTE